MHWKFKDDLCGHVETEEHVLFECNRYGQERQRWRGTIKKLQYGMCEYEVIKGYHMENREGNNVAFVCVVE